MSTHQLHPRGAWNPRRIRLVAAVLAAVAAAIAIGVATSATASDGSDSTRHDAERSAAQVSELVRNSIENNVRHAMVLARIPSTADAEALGSMLDAAVQARGDFDLILLTDAAGTIVATSSVDHLGSAVGTDQLIGRNVSDEGWFGTVTSGPTDQVHQGPPTQNALTTEIYGDGRIGLEVAGRRVGLGNEPKGAWYAVLSFDRTVLPIVREANIGLDAQRSASELVVASNLGGLPRTWTESTAQRTRFGVLQERNPIDESRGAAAGSESFLHAYAPVSPSAMNPIHAWGVVATADTSHGSDGRGWWLVAALTLGAATATCLIFVLAPRRRHPGTQTQILGQKVISPPRQPLTPHRHQQETPHEHARPTSAPAGCARRHGARTAHDGRRPRFESSVGGQNGRRRRA